MTFLKMIVYQILLSEVLYSSVTPQLLELFSSLPAIYDMFLVRILAHNSLGAQN